MKALTLTQPWATLMAIGKKRIETRGWRTTHRGELAVHASAASVLTQSPAINDALRGVQVPYGCVVAVLDLTDCLRVEKLNLSDLTAAERAFGDFTVGRYGWLTENVRPLKHPVVCRGNQSIWTLPPDIEAQVRAQL